MTNPNPETVSKLAKAFADTLREWLTPEEFAEMVELNQTAEYADGCCASHNYCDANMAMDKAFHIVLGRGAALPCDGDMEAVEADLQLWESAWEEARELYIGKVSGPFPDETRHVAE